jgi:DNA-binding IscR family transcriptional regulator
LIRDVWDELRAVLQRYLASVTLDDLVQRKQQILGEIMYYI